MTTPPEDTTAGFYSLVLTQQRSGKDVLWTATHPDLPGCHAVARDPQEALRRLEPIREEWLELARAHCDEVPEPNESAVVLLRLDRDHTPEDVQAGRAAIALAQTPTISFDVPALTA